MIGAIYRLGRNSGRIDVSHGGAKPPIKKPANCNALYLYIGGLPELKFIWIIATRNRHNRNFELQTKEVDD